MTTQETNILETQIKRSTLGSNIVSLIIAIIGAASVCFGFYYKTDDHLSRHDDDIKEIKEKTAVITAKVDKADVIQGANAVEIKSIQDKIQRIEKTQDRIEDKLDRVLERRK